MYTGVKPARQATAVPHSSFYFKAFHPIHLAKKSIKNIFEKPAKMFGPRDDRALRLYSPRPWYDRYWYSNSYKYSHFYGGTVGYPYSQFPLQDLYKSPWLDRPYHYKQQPDWYR